MPAAPDKRKSQRSPLLVAVLFVAFVLALGLLVGGKAIHLRDGSGVDASPYQRDETFTEVERAVRGGGALAGDGDTVYANPGDDLRELARGLHPGDTLLLRGGTYATDLNLSNLRGRSDAWITIAAAPGEEAVLDGGSMRPSVMVSVSTCSYLRISGLAIRNASGRDSCGISVSPGSNHVVLDRNRISDISVSATPQEGDCANGILLFGDSAREAISEVYLYGNELRDCETGWSECISISGHVRGVDVEANRIDNISNIGIDFAGNYGYCPDPALDFPVDCSATNNVVSNCRSEFATSYGLYMDGGQRIRLEGNQVRSCSGGIEIGAEKVPSKEGYSTGDIQVRNNTIEGCDEAGMSIGGYSRELGWVQNVTVEGNNCRNNGGEDGAILALSKCRYVTLRGNVLQNQAGRAEIVSSEMGPDQTKDISFDGNSYGNGLPADGTRFSFCGQVLHGL